MPPTRAADAGVTGSGLGARPEAGPPGEGDASAVTPDAAPPPSPPDCSASGVAADGTCFDASAPVDAAPSPGMEDAPVPTLLGEWTFDEGAGPTSADLSGRGHPALFVGGALWGQGKTGRGLELDGAGYADVGVTLVDTTKSFTVTCWAQLAAVGTWETAISEDDVLGSLLSLKLRGDAANAFDFDMETSDLLNPGYVVAQSQGSGAVGVWVHLAGVYVAGTMGSLTLYLDGVRDGSFRAPAPFPSALGHFILGRGLYNGAAGSYFQGTLDDVEVYDDALSDGQVAAIYASEK